MDIPLSRWYPAIELRRSRRNYNPQRQIEPAKFKALELVCKSFVPFRGARSVLVNNPALDIFKGVIGSYGKVKGAPAFVAFIGNRQSPNMQEEAGYTGEGIILEATTLGLNTCWVGGFFKHKNIAALVDIGSDERILAVSPLGYASQFESLEEQTMTGFGRSHKRLSIQRISDKFNRNDFPTWMKASIDAARLAPSAINRQPWGFKIQDDNIMVYVRTRGPEFSVSKRLDCGIAMLHFEAASLYFGIKGKWQFLKSPQVAEFVVQPEILRPQL